MKSEILSFSLSFAGAAAFAASVDSGALMTEFDDATGWKVEEK